jgi:hypothetical protein
MGSQRIHFYVITVQYHGLQSVVLLHRIFFLGPVGYYRQQSVRYAMTYRLHT